LTDSDYCFINKVIIVALQVLQNDIATLGRHYYRCLLYCKNQITW